MRGGDKKKGDKRPTRPPPTQGALPLPGAEAPAEGPAGGALDCRLRPHHHPHRHPPTPQVRSQPTNCDPQRNLCTVAEGRKEALQTTHPPQPGNPRATRDRRPATRDPQRVTRNRPRKNDPAQHYRKLTTASNPTVTSSGRHVRMARQRHQPPAHVSPYDDVNSQPSYLPHANRSTRRPLRGANRSAGRLSMHSTG